MTEQEHKAFIKANPFEFAVSRHGFTEKEVQTIERLGNWFNALARKKIAATTEGQKRFVKEMNRREAPTMEHVTLWKRYLRREIEEKDVRSVLNAPPPEIEDDPFYSRKGAKELRKGQFKTITEQHRK